MKKLFLLLLFFWSSSCLLYSQNKGKVHQLDSVVVSASAKRALKQTQLSAVALPASAVFAMPATLGETDVLKSLQMLPGVQGGGDGNVSLYIRGGASSQNLYLVDGAPLYNPEHFKGYVSAINPIAVSDLILYKGGFPAQFGNRLSGIVDVALKRGRFQQLAWGCQCGTFVGIGNGGRPHYKRQTFGISLCEKVFLSRNYIKNCGLAL